jgi:chromosomal replication initiator protein
MTDKNNIWPQVKKDLEHHIPQSEFKRWISEASLAKIDAEQAIFEVPNKFIAQWIEEKYSRTIQAMFKRHLSIQPDIVFTHIHGAVKDKDNTKNIGPKFADSTPGNDIDPLNTFNTFVISDSNRLAYSSALSMATEGSTQYNPLYLYSPLSVGKTHLLHAIANQVLLQGPTSQAVYFSSGSAIPPLPPPSQGPNHPALRRRKGHVDCLLVDDIHLLADCAEAQKDLLYIFDLYMEFNKRLTITGNSAPNNISGLNPQLKSRLKSGVITEIRPPEQQTTIKIIKKKAEQQELNLSEDVLFFFAGSSPNLKVLQETMQRIKAHQEITGEEIDISAVQSILTQAAVPDITIRQIQSACARYFNVPLSDLLSHRKDRHISYPRQVAVYLSRTLTDLSLKAIAKAFGNKHHTSILYAINRIETEKKRKRRVMKDLNEIHKRLVV